jgi:hypothetical protein
LKYFAQRLMNLSRFSVSIELKLSIVVLKGRMKMALFEVGK